MDRTSVDTRQPARAGWKRLQGIAIAACMSSACLLLPGAALADAKLVHIEGTVLVNTGEGYQTPVQPMALKSGARTIQVDGPMSLKAGDRIMLRKSSSAELRYGDGCRVPLVAGQFFTISRVSPCAVKACTPGATGCAVISGGTGLGTGSLTPVAIVAGTGLVAGVAGMIIGSLNEDNGGSIKKTFFSP
ncbi:MAG: hypothetical protein KDJ29_14195 [Hyphomicrobiales bacterium]|nr:hypothetical protein [Hyphomicrobiales bacterium]